MRLLWAGRVQGLRHFANCAPDRLLDRMYRRASARRSRDTIDSSEKRADFESERLLLLSVRRVVRSRGGGRVVHAAVAIFDLVRFRLLGGFDCFWILVQPHRQEAVARSDALSSQLL